METPTLRCADPVGLRCGVRQDQSSGNEQLLGGGGRPVQQRRGQPRDVAGVIADAGDLQGSREIRRQALERLYSGCLGDL